MKRHLIAISALCASLTAGAQSLDSLARHIAIHNPAFVARTAEFQAAQLSLQASGMLPAPEIEGEYLWGPSGTSGRWGVGISQSFDWPGVYAARKEERRAAATAFSELASTERAEYTLAAKLALIDLVAARAQSATIRKIYNNIIELEQLTARQMEHGQATILDLRKLQIESLDLASRLEEAELERESAIARLSEMGFGGSVPDDLTYPVAASACDSELWLRSPAMRAAKAKVQSSRSAAKAAARSIAPGFTVGFRHAFEDRTHFNGLTLGIALPAWGSRRAKAAAQADALAAEANAEAISASLMATYTESVRKLDALKTRMDAYARALDTTDYPELLKKSLIGGQISTLTYIQELNFFLEARLAQQQTEQQYHTVLANLSKFNI